MNRLPMQRQTRGNRLTGRRTSRLTVATGLLLAMFLIAGSVIPAYADIEPPPPIPHDFSGVVIVDGAPVDQGTLVEALVDGVTVRSTTVDDQSSYSLLVPGPGTAVTFRIGGVPANETATWESGRIDEDFHLTIGEPAAVLTIFSTDGGSVTKPGEGKFIYFQGTVVSLVATAAFGYQFTNWTGNVDTVTNRNAHSTTITMQGDYGITANFAEAASPGPFPFPFPCFIATAAYGTPTAEQLDVLREFRDVVLLESTAGTQFVALYYRTSPPVADFIAKDSFLRTLVRELLVDPVVWLVEATGDMWRHSAKQP